MRTRPLKKIGTLLLSASLLGATIAPAQAAMVGTAQAVAAQQGALDRAGYPKPAFSGGRPAPAR